MTRWLRPVYSRIDALLRFAPEPFERTFKWCLWKAWALASGEQLEVRSPRGLTARRAVRARRLGRADIPGWLLEDMSSLAAEADPMLAPDAYFGLEVVEQSFRGGLDVPGRCYRALLARLPSKVEVVHFLSAVQLDVHEATPVSEPSVSAAETELAVVIGGPLRAMLVRPGIPAIALADVDPQGALNAGEEELILLRLLLQLRPRQVTATRSRLGQRVRDRYTALSQRPLSAADEPGHDQVEGQGHQRS